MDDRFKGAAGKFLAANGVYAGLALAALGLDDAVLTMVMQAPLISALSMLGLEATTVGALWMLQDATPPKGSGADPFNAGLEEVVIRNSCSSDGDSTEAVYLEWFPSSLSIDDAEFNKLMSRCVHVRIAEEIHAGGTTRVVGYYSIWPMSRTNYEALVEGTLKEREFTAAMIVPPNSKTAEVLYVSEICVRKDSTAGTVLLKDAMSYILAIARRNTKVQCVAAWGSTPIGRSIATRMGMTKVSRKSGKVTQFYAIKRSDAFRVLAGASSFRPEWRVSYR